MKSKNIYSIQEWLPFDRVLENGVIKLKDANYIKIIKIIPINYNLKSNLEKEAILNSYKILLKTCDFNFQILIQSNKENLSKIISKINQEIENEKNKKIIQYSKNYINYIQELNHKSKSASKDFFILIKTPINNNLIEETVVQDLRDKYFKLKECLSRCGNISYEITNKIEIIKVIKLFLNKK